MLKAIAIALVLAVLPVGAQASGAADLAGTMMSKMGSRQPVGCPNKWCACYLKQSLAKSGHKTLQSNRAIDFKRYGVKARPASIGSIMVMRNHVGVVIGKCDGGKVKLVSGNHSRRVGVGCYAPSKAVAWRAPVRHKATKKVHATVKKSRQNNR